MFLDTGFRSGESSGSRSVRKSKRKYINQTQILYHLCNDLQMSLRFQQGFLRNLAQLGLLVSVLSTMVAMGKGVRLNFPKRHPMRTEFPVHFRLRRHTSEAHSRL